MLYWLPIEPLEERYSEQWYRWFPEEFKKQGIQFSTIDGTPLLEYVKVGTFLDINSTIAYKSDQIRKIALLFHNGAIQDGDIFFLADAEMFGLEYTIRYLAELNNLNVKIAAFAHAGSYTKEDFVEKCSYFARFIESGWGDIFDHLFVGSEYHKDRLMDLRFIPSDQIMVTGNPYNLSEVRNQITPQEKINQVIHTNRPDSEKRPEKTLRVFQILKKTHPDWKFVVTTSRKQWGSGHLRTMASHLQQDIGVIEIKEGLTKTQYLEELAKSKVMTGNTIEENFGYCILEALLFGTIPVVSNAYSHPELCANDNRCLFDDTGDQVRKIEQAMAMPFLVDHYADRYDGSLSKIVECLK